MPRGLLTTMTSVFAFAASAVSPESAPGDGEEARSQASSAGPGGFGAAAPTGADGASD